MDMKHRLLTFLLAFCCLSNVMASSLSGSTWVTIDDKTGKPHADVQFEEDNGTLTARIITVFPQPGDTGICSKCPGNLKDKPVKNLVFIWGLKQKGNDNWEGGNILDPRTGKIYRAKVLLKGDKLYVRGYLGVSLLGRTQIWERKKNS